MLACRRTRVLLWLSVAILSVLSACEKVPLLAPTGSTITLTALTTALSANGSTSIIGQVLEQAGTPPHSGTHVTFNTTLGRIEPAEISTDVNGRVAVTFFAGGVNGTATITAISGGATTGTDRAIKIAVGTAAVGRVSVNAVPAAVPASGGSTTITANVIDINGNALIGSPVSFSTTAGSLSSSLVTTDVQGNAQTVLTTGQEADVTASVGATATTSSGTTTTASGQASGTVKVRVLGAPALTITPPSTQILRGVPSSYVFTITAAATNPSPIREVTVNWGDGFVQNLGSFTGAQPQSHTYSNEGTFAITGTVTDAAGSTTTVVATVAVVAPPRPTVLVTANVLSSPTVGSPVTFSVTVTPAAGGPTIRSTSIDYGDGQREDLGGALSAQRSHIYQTHGTFLVTVSALDSAGQTTVGSVVIRINEAP